MESKRVPTFENIHRGKVGRGTKVLRHRDCVVQIEHLPVCMCVCVCIRETLSDTLTHWHRQTDRQTDRHRHKGIRTVCHQSVGTKMVSPGPVMVSIGCWCGGSDSLMDLCVYTCVVCVCVCVCVCVIACVHDHIDTHKTTHTSGKGRD